MPGPPLVSVVMPVYNDEATVGRAIDSILAQTFRDFEFIIIDDGSTDGTSAVLASYNDPRLRVFRQENAGISVSANRGLARARGKYIARIDGDDRALPTRLATQVAYMEEHPDCVLVGSWWDIVSLDGQRLGSRRPPTEDLGIKWALLFDSCILHSAFLMRHDAVKRCGGYDRTLAYAQDYDLASRLGNYGALANIPRVLVEYLYDHESSVSVVHRAEQREEAERISGEAILRIMGDDLITLAQQRACRELVCQPRGLRRGEAMLAVRALARIAAHFRRAYGKDRAGRVMGEASAAYARSLTLPAEHGRANQLRNLLAALALHPGRGAPRNATVGLAYTLLGAARGIRIFEAVRQLRAAPGRGRPTVAWGGASG